MAVQKNRKMSKDERIREACIWEIQSAMGVARDRLKNSRKEALDYYFCNPRGDEVEGRSAVISPDCRAMVDATVAQLVDMVSQDKLCDFEADGEEDEDSANLESKLCNAVVQDFNQGAVELQDAIFDALTLGDGVVKFYAEETQEEQTQRITDMEPEMRFGLQVPQQPNEERHLDLDDDDETSGTLTVTTTNVEFKMCSVAAERFLYPINHDSHMLTDAHFCAEEMTRTRSELVLEGFEKSVVDDIPAAEMDTNETSRKRNKGSTNYTARATSDQEHVEIHECYIRIDLDNDGEGELYRVLLANKDVVLEYEEVEFVPFVLGAALLQGQRLGGQALLDILRPIQDIKTALWRQRLDNAYRANNNIVVYDPRRVNEEDVLNPKAGGGIASKDPQGAVAPLPFFDVGPSIRDAMMQANEVRTELGGAALDMASADAQLVGETAHGIERQMGNRELHIAMMARNLAETLLSPLFLLVHKTMRTYANKPIQMKIKGEWQQIDPSQWPERKRVNITTGDSMGVKRAKASALMASMQMQQAAIQGGMSGVLADTKTLYRTQRDYLRLNGIDQPHLYSIDPETPEAQQAAQQNAQSAQQQQQQIDRLAQSQAQTETQKLQVDLAKVQNETQRWAAELQYKYADLAAQMEMKEAELIGSATLELQKMTRDAQTKANNGTDTGRSEADQGGVAGPEQGSIQ